MPYVYTNTILACTVNERRGRMVTPTSYPGGRRTKYL